MPSQEIRTPRATAFREFCESIMATDSSIRFVGVANKYGTLIESAYRKDLKPLMDQEETGHYAIQSVFRSSTRETFQSKIGKQRYAIAVYEKLIRATIPIIIIIKDNNSRNYDDDDHNDNKVGEQKKHAEAKQQLQQEQNSRFCLLISFDLGSEVISIIENKILPQVEERKHLLLVQ